MEPLHLTYAVSFRDFMESVRGYRRISKAAAIFFYVDVIGLPVLGGLAALFWLYLFFSGDRANAMDLIWLAILGLVAATLLPSLYALRMRQVYRQRTVLTNMGTVEMTATPEGIRFAVSGGASVEYLWSAFTHVRETPNTFALYVHKAAFHTISKSSLNAEQLSQLRAFLSTYCVKC